VSVDNPEAGAGTESGVDRRGLMRNAAGLGVAGIAAGVLLGGAAPASAAAPAAAAPGKPAEATAPAEPLVVHVRDVAAGRLDLYRGEEHREVVDPALAAALARHAR
jgi:hypothetical protein